MLLRLAHSEHHQQLVLKGGVLLAAYDSRRPTADLDFAATGMTNDQDRVLELVRDTEFVKVVEAGGSYAAAVTGSCS